MKASVFEARNDNGVKPTPQVEEPKQPELLRIPSGPSVQQSIAETVFTNFEKEIAKITGGY